VTDIEEITSVEIGLPGPSGTGISAAQYAALVADVATALAGLGITVQDESVALTTQATTLDFVGAGVEASGTGAVKTITIAGGTVAIIVQQDDATVEAAATTIDVASPLTATVSPAGEANIAHGNHNPTLFNQTTKSYSSTSVSTTEATVLSLSIGPLINGVLYDVIGFGIAQAGGGAGFLDIGIKLGTDATVFGMRVGTVGGERPVAASDDAPVTGTGASVTVALRAVVTTGTGAVVAAHVFAFAIPRR
jgi:hypothetical protein